MIRFISLIALFAASSIVLGQPLYKWIESDGSITFSVEPPEAGIEFETVDTTQKVLPEAPKANSVPKANTIVPALQQALPPSTTMPEVKPSIQNRRQPYPETQGIVPAAPTLQNGRGSTRSETTTQRLNGLRSSGGNATTSGVSGEQRNLPSGTRQVEAAPMSRKQRQCEDLQKRVVSLERRLKTRLTPDDMDNTVIHMARYQRSFDKHCTP